MRLPEMKRRNVISLDCPSRLSDNVTSCFVLIVNLERFVSYNGVECNGRIIKQFLLSHNLYFLLFFHKRHFPFSLTEEGDSQ
jgi:hypothetical protein